MSTKNHGNKYKSLSDEWNELSQCLGATIKNNGVCTTFEWMNVLQNVFNKKVESASIYCEDGSGKVCGVLPFYKDSPTKPLMKSSLISHTELYSTRAGLLVKGKSQECLNSLLSKLLNTDLNWSSLTLTVIDGSADEALLLNGLNHFSLNYILVKKVESPYRILDKTYEEMFNSLSKKFRRLLRKRSQQLGETGPVRYVLFETVEQVPQFLKEMYIIERNSWKEGAGTSITTNPIQKAFYDEFTPIAAEKGWLCSFILYAGDVPVGYIYGIRYNQVFEGLKSSYDDNYRSFSPGHLIYLNTLESLYNQDVTCFDFMGKVEETKERWMSNTYSQSTYMIYNKTWTGTLAYIAGKAKGFIKNILQKVKSNEE